MNKQQEFWKNLIYQFKQELIDKYVTKVVKEEITINRPGKDDSWYQYYMIYTNTSKEPIQITFAKDRGFCRFETSPKQEVEKSLLLTEPNYVDGEKWIIKLAEKVSDVKMINKFKHSFAFLNEYEKLERVISKSLSVQNKIIEHLSSNNFENLEVYSDLVSVKAGKTTNGSSRYYSGWDIYLDFDDVYFGSDEFIDNKKLDFETYRDYQNIFECTTAVNQGFEAYKRYKNGTPIEDVYGLELKDKDNDSECEFPF